MLFLRPFIFISKICGTMTKKVRGLKKGNHIRFLEKNNWEYIKRCNCSGIVIISAMMEKGDVILTEQFRIPVGRYVMVKK